MALISSNILLLLGLVWPICVLSTYTHPVVLMGMKGVGKSSIANTLLRRSQLYNGVGFKNGCFKVCIVFPVFYINYDHLLYTKKLIYLSFPTVRVRQCIANEEKNLSYFAYSVKFLFLYC